MATEQEKVAVRRWFEEGAQNVAVFDEVLSPDIVMSLSGMPEPLRGIAAVKQLEQTFRTAFPDIRLTVDRLTDQGDTITVQWRGQGTHTGPMNLPTGGSIPPTGKRISFQTTDTVRVAGGKIVEDRSGMNMMDILGQLGVNLPSE